VIPDPTDEVRRRLQASAAVVDPLADSLELRTAHLARRTRRLRGRQRVALVVALCLSVSVAGTLVVLAGRGGPTHEPVVSPASVRVDLAATPKGWMRVDYADTQISVPSSWTARTEIDFGSTLGGGIMLGPSSPLSTFAAVNTPANPESGTTQIINGITVRVSSRSSLAFVPAMNVEIAWGGSLGRRVLDTLTWSPEAVALASGSPAIPPAWRRLSFSGVSFAVPSEWKVQPESDLLACYPPLSIPPSDGTVVLNTDQRTLICSPAGSIRFDQASGVDVNLRGSLVAGAESRYTFNKDCHTVRSAGTALKVCVSSEPPPDILLLETTLAGHQPMVFSIGQFGDGTVDREIYDSIEAAEPQSRTATVEPEEPGPMATGPQGQLYFSDDALNEVLERLPDGTFRVIAGDGRAGYGATTGRLSGLSCAIPKVWLWLSAEPPTSPTSATTAYERYCRTA